MHYIVLIIGVLVGLYALYRFFIKAEVSAIRTFFRICIIIIYAIILLFFAMTGRIIISLGLLLLGIPFAIGYFKENGTKADAESLEGSQSDTEDE